VRAVLLTNDAMVWIGRTDHLTQFALRAAVGLGNGIERAATALVIGSRAAEKRRYDPAGGFGQFMSECAKLCGLCMGSLRHLFTDRAGGFRPPALLQLR